MRNILLTLVICSVFVLVGNAQTMPADCPENYVCVTKEAARAALQAGDKVKALEAEAKEQEKAYNLIKDALHKMEVEFARASGENTALKQQAIRDAAMIELLLKQTKKKRIGLINIL